MINKDVSYLAPEDFGKFLNAIPKISGYHGKGIRKPPLSPDQLQLLFKITYYCALRMTETLKLIKSDFDLENRILTTRESVSALNETTIPPILIGELRAYLKNLRPNQKLFEIHRQTIWSHSKNVGNIAGLKIFRSTTKRSVQGIFTLLFRHSYQLQMLQEGANEHLVDLKLRVKSESNYGGYKLEDLKEWEQKHYKEFLNDEDIKTYVQWYAENLESYKKLALKVEQVIKDILDSKGVTYHYINSREKKIESFEKKLREGIHYKPKEMQDLAGIRVICYVKSEVDKIWDIIEKNFEIDKARSHDKSKILGQDKMGYQSIHYVAKFSKDRTNLDEFKKFDGLYFEIQIRTILQHAWAEIEHDKLYKATEIVPKNVRRQFYLLSSVLEISDNEFQRLVEKLQST